MGLGGRLEFDSSKHGHFFYEDMRPSIEIEPERQLAWAALAAPAQARPRTPGGRLAVYHIFVNTAGLHASAAMGLGGRLEFDSSKHGLC
jgi:hypothetical protein